MGTRLTAASDAHRTAGAAVPRQRTPLATRHTVVLPRLAGEPRALYDGRGATWWRRRFPELAVGGILLAVAAALARPAAGPRDLARQVQAGGREWAEAPAVTLGDVYPILLAQVDTVAGGTAARLAATAPLLAAVWWVHVAARHLLGRRTAVFAALCLAGVLAAPGAGHTAAGNLALAVAAAGLAVAARSGARRALLLETGLLLAAGAVLAGLPGAAAAGVAAVAAVAAAGRVGWGWALVRAAVVGGLAAGVAGAAVLLVGAPAVAGRWGGSVLVLGPLAALATAGTVALVTARRHSSLPRRSARALLVAVAWVAAGLAAAAGREVLAALWLALPAGAALARLGGYSRWRLLLATVLGLGAALAASPVVVG